MLFKHRKKLVIFLCALLLIQDGALALAATESKPADNPYTERYWLLRSASALTGVDWTYLAAVDQYERTLNQANPKKRPKYEGLIAIHYTAETWTGSLNPNQDDTSPHSISLFGGVGKDGSGDGKADRNNDQDRLMTMALHLSSFGPTEDDIREALWEHYQSDRSVRRIEQFRRIIKQFQSLDLFGHAFPLPLHANYSYRSTWGAGRSYGGRRIHEGTDIFAGYGVPVKSTCYGIIEVMGWNRFGGWRVGIRDLNNVYHYYAHLSGFNKEWKEGGIIKPGEVIGWVGSSGYGKPGTQGKFPPHLHYGMYRDSGTVDWSFDPYPYLRKWEREQRARK